VTDEAMMSRLFYSLSDATVYKRWHHSLKQLPHRDILRLLEVDYAQNMAVVIEAELKIIRKNRLRFGTGR
jgi:hypothetical protein